MGRQGPGEKNVDCHYPTINRIVAIFIAIIAALCLCSRAMAEPHREIRLFVVEKSKNPQNILVVYAHVDAACKIQPIVDAAGPHLFDFYWLMDRTRFKPTHRLIKKAVRKRFVPLKSSIRDRRFKVLLADLKELIHDLPSATMDVEIKRDAQGACQGRAMLALGPAHANRTLVIDTIYSKAKTFLGIPVGIHYIELRGKDIDSHAPLTARFNSTRLRGDEKTTTNDLKINLNAPGCVANRFKMLTYDGYAPLFHRSAPCREPLHLF